MLKIHFFLCLLISANLLLIWIPGEVQKNSTFAISNITMNASANPLRVTEGNNLILDVMISNKGNTTASSLNVGVASTGFKIVSEKVWPVVLYPRSEISGQYVLQSTHSGSHPINVGATYTVNKTINSKKPDIQQFALSDKINNVYVDPNYVPTLSTFWQGVASVAIGAALGIVITKISDKIARIGATERERKEGIRKVKNYLIQWLDICNEKLKLFDPAEFGRAGFLVM